MRCVRDFHLSVELLSIVTQNSNVLDDFRQRPIDESCILSKMIFEHRSPEPIWGYFFRHLAYRKRRGISSCYSSHGLSYVLLLLLYGFTIIETGNSMDSTIQDGKTMQMSQAVVKSQIVTDVAVKTPVLQNDEEVEEFYDDDLDDEERFMLNNAGIINYYTKFLFKNVCFLYFFPSKQYGI